MIFKRVSSPDVILDAIAVIDVGEIYQNVLLDQEMFSNRGYRFRFLNTLYVAHYIICKGLQCWKTYGIKEYNRVSGGATT